MKLTPLEPWINQKIVPNQIEDWQLQKLNETLILAREKSPFYRKLFAEMPQFISSLDEFRKFPFTTPEDVRRNPLQFVCVSQDNIQRVVTLQSSGTTGEPKRIYFTADDQELTIDFFGVGMSTLTEPDERVLILLPGETPGSVGDLLRIGLQRSGRQPIPYGPVRDPLHALDVMQTGQVDCLVGSPTQMLGLARRARPGGHKPRSVLLSTDYVPQSIVTILEQVWGSEIYNHYGTTEMGLGGGVECAARRGYHLREADLYFEVIDPLTGKAIPSGHTQRGEVVFSTLTRRGMPLIRYRTGDRSRFIPGNCPCGTHLKTLEKVSGRFSGTVSIGDEVLSLPDFDEALFPIPDLLNFSVTVTGEIGQECLVIETQMLNAIDPGLIKKALEMVPATHKMRVKIQCQHNPQETGSLLKRVISDKRGQNA